MDNSTKQERAIKELFPIANEARVILRRIQLRINPRDEDPYKLEDDEFLTSLADLLNPGKIVDLSDASWNRLSVLAIENARKILKRKWEMTKQLPPRWL